METKINFVSGNMLSYNADILVNTVNCVGVMGAGVALAFKNKFPDMYKDYVTRCRRKEVFPGHPYLWYDNSLFNGNTEKIIINFPTKDHWRNPSQYEYIEKGLIWMKNALQDFKGKTIAIPALGCGLGGLDWIIVKDMIVSILSNIGLNILIFEPHTNAEYEMRLSETERSFITNNQIALVTPADSSYPQSLKGKSALSFCCKGNLSSLHTSNSVNIIFGKNPTKREFDAVCNCIKNMASHDVVLVLGLGSAFDMDLLQYCLEKKLHIILVIPSGIMNLTLRNDVIPLWNEKLVTVISLQKPSAPWNSNIIGKVNWFRLQISKKVLICSFDLNAIQHYVSTLKKEDTYFMNFWSTSNAFFSSINAKPIGRDHITGEARINELVAF